MDAMAKVIDKGADAFKALLIMFFVTIPIVGVLSNMAFNAVSTAFQDNAAAQTAVGGAEAAYNVGGTFQDVLDVVKIVWPVIIAIGTFVGSGIVLITKFGDRLQDLADWLEDLFNR